MTQTHPDLRDAALSGSPLERAPEQPPCDSEAEALCLNGMFAAPERMAHFDLTPHLIFVEHRSIWRSMRRGPADDGLWLWTLQDLQHEHGDAALDVLTVLMWSPVQVVDRSDDGCLIFMLALAKIKRCTVARQRIQLAQEEVTRQWRIPNTPYSPEEKRALLGPYRVDIT
jgi:hypothetical protein